MLDATSTRSVIVAALLVIAGCFAPSTSSAASSRGRPSPIVGRWDLHVLDPKGEYPSWLEVSEQDGSLVGRFVGRIGGERGVAVLRVRRDSVGFEVLPQFESRTNPLRFLGRLNSGSISGVTENDAGEAVPWTAERAPRLDRAAPPRWGEPIALLEGNAMTTWGPRHGIRELCWALSDGVLSNTGPCDDYVTAQRFDDLKLHAEFRLGEGGDSGIHLRGRYEIQLRDPETERAEERSATTGSVYGFLSASTTTPRPAGEWQTLDLTLVGRRITVVLNGETVIDNAEIPGITGDALDSDESKSGPIMLQGYLGPIEFRKLIVTPAI